MITYECILAPLVASDKEIAFVSDRDARGIYARHVDTGVERQLAADPAGLHPVLGAGRVGPGFYRRGLRTFERRCFLVDVNSVVLARVARPCPVAPIQTLDAMHLATAEWLDEPPQRVTIVTCDTQGACCTASCAQALDLRSSA